MNPLNALTTPLSIFGTDALNRWLLLLLQITLPLTAALIALSVMRRNRPPVRLFLANGTLLAIFALLILSLCSAGRYRALWTLRLPTDATAAGGGAVDVRRTPAAAVATMPSREPTSLPAQRPQLELPVRAYASDRFAAGTAHTTHDRSGLASRDGLLSTAAPSIAWPAVLEAAKPSLSLSALRCQAVIAVWCLGALFLLCWLAFSCLAVAILRHRCPPIHDEHALAMLAEQGAALGVRPPALLASDRARGPFLIGLWRPAIILPYGYQDDFAGDSLRAVLTHELAHLVQRDGYWTLLGRLLCTFCWPNPLLWALCRQRAEAAEEACDAMVLAQGCSRPAYARCLLTLAERLCPARVENAATLGMIGSRSALRRRIEQVLTGRDPSPTALTVQIKIPVLLLAPLLICGALYAIGTPHDQHAEAQSVPALARPDLTQQDMQDHIAAQMERKTQQQALHQQLEALKLHEAVAQQQVYAVLRQREANNQLEHNSRFQRQLAANALRVALLQRELQRLRQTPNSKNSLSKQRARQAEDEQTAVRQHLMELQAQQAALQAQQTALQADVKHQLMKTQAIVVRHQAREAALKRRLETLISLNAELVRRNNELARQNASLSTDRVEQNSQPTLIYIQRQLLEAEADLADRKLRYDSGHPAVQQAQERVDLLTAQWRKLKQHATPDLLSEMLRLKLQQLQIRRICAINDLAELRSRYSDSYPKIGLTKTRITSLDEQILQCRREYEESLKHATPTGAGTAPQDHGIRNR